MTKAQERRRYIRLTTPINIKYIIRGKDKVLKAVSKDVSAVGVRFETAEQIKPKTTLELTLEVPKALNPVHAQGKIIWSRKASLEDGAPYDIGVEFTRIEEDNKNTFLKFLCDLIYRRG